MTEKAVPFRQASSPEQETSGKSKQGGSIPGIAVPPAKYATMFEIWQLVQAAFTNFCAEAGSIHALDPVADAAKLAKSNLQFLRAFKQRNPSNHRSHITIIKGIHYTYVDKLGKCVLSLVAAADAWTIHKTMQEGPSAIHAWARSTTVDVRPLIPSRAGAQPSSTGNQGGSSILATGVLLANYAIDSSELAKKHLHLI